MKMFTFGYGSRISGPLRALIALVIGIMMVLRPDNALTTVVKVIAAFILASGVVSLIVGLKEKKNGSLPLMSFNAVVDIIIGLVLFMFPLFVAKFINHFLASLWIKAIGFKTRLKRNPLRRVI